MLALRAEANTLPVSWHLPRPRSTDLAAACIHVIKCDDLDGHNACEPDEPSLDRVNDRNRYELATMSKRAQFTLTVASRNDPFCEGYNWDYKQIPAGALSVAAAGPAQRGSPSRCSAPNTA